MADYSPITIARFWSKVEVKKEITHCWIWRGAMAKSGYGRIKVNGINLTASRVAWELFNGASLGNQYALHHCDNPKCCNPYHIYAGSREDNANDVKHAKLTKLGIGPLRTRERQSQRRYKAMVLARVSKGDRVCDLSVEFGIPYTTIHSWVRRSK